MNIADPALCNWDAAPYLIISDNVWGNFIYYSHLLPAITVLLIAVLVFRYSPRTRATQSLLFIAFVFSAWSLIDLVLWASERSDIIMFFWSILIHFDLLIYVGAFYFMHAFIKNQLPEWWKELVIAFLFVPLFLFAHTSLNLVGFDFTNCWREAFEGPLWQYYVYTAELFLVAWILLFSIRQFRSSTSSTARRQIILVTVGTLLFLVSFSLGNIAGSIAVDWELGQYGLFGMPIFVAFLAYLIVKYKAFNAQALASEVLIGGLAVLITSLLFIRNIENIKIVAVLTLALTIVLGTLLIRNVRREIKQREEIQRLAKDLEQANARLQELDKLKSEFVSIASHQLRSPLTSIRGYASMLLEGSYGKLTKKAAEAIARIHQSSRYMALTVEDFLNVSRIEAGTMKYDVTDFDICTMAKELSEDIMPAVTEKDLEFTFISHIDGTCLVHADIGKTRQILQNLIDNAAKYTQKGSVTVTLERIKDGACVALSVSDTGIGMSKETQQAIFKKFARAKNANKVNVIGSGLGLYVAREMAEQMGGTVTAESKGEGKGSTFTVRLPLAGAPAEKKKAE